jgi:Niemann-Pick C1 protein
LKLWVSPGSQTADEKQYFDSHLAPFYRIEQVFPTLLTFCFVYLSFVYQLATSSCVDVHLLSAFLFHVLHLKMTCVTSNF